MVTSSPAARSDSTKLPTSRSSSGNRHLLVHPLAVEADHVVDRAGDRVPWRPTSRRLQACGLGTAVGDLFEAGLVGHLERNEAQLRVRARLCEHPLGQVEDGDLLGRADVEDLPDRGLAVEEGNEGPHRVVHMQEAARLRAIAIDRERLAGERLAHEPGEYHPVLAGLARAHRVAQANDDVLRADLAVIAESKAS